MANFNFGTTVDLTKSDTANARFNMVLVTTAGSLVVGQTGGNVITLASVPANVWIPVGDATHITTASTADGIMVV